MGKVAYYEVLGTKKPTGSLLSAKIPEHSGHAVPFYTFSEYILDDPTQAPGHTLIRSPKVRYDAVERDHLNHMVLLKGSKGKHSPMPKLCPCCGAEIPFILMGGSKVRVNGIDVVFVDQEVDWTHGTGRVEEGHMKIQSVAW